MDYYKILNVSETSTLKEIEQVYKDLSSFYNPENNVSRNAYKKYREVNEAYKVLSEIKQKEMYDRLHVTSEETEEYFNKGDLVDISYYLNNKTSEVSSYEINEELANSFNEVRVKLDISYLYYLTNSDYTFTYTKESLTFTDNKCNVCDGVGRVKKDNKIVICPECLGYKKECKRKEKKNTITVCVNDSSLVLEESDHKLIVEFNFYDKEFFKMNNNEIFVDYLVSEKEYREGIKFNLVKGDLSIHIDSLNFKNSIYTFLDKIIHINYILTKYRGKDVNAYLLTDLSVIYLNLNDFTYKDSPSKDHTYRLNVNDSLLTLEGLGEKGYNDKNGNLIVKVIRVNNTKDEYLFFNRKLKKVSSNLFKFMGKYEGHMFTIKKHYDYDDEYIYIPSRAYKLKNKSYLLFKIMYLSLYMLVPLILYMIMGFNLAFCIVTGVFFVVYLICSNLLMEVKI